jgi:hypothetical protein
MRRRRRWFQQLLRFNSCYAACASGTKSRRMPAAALLGLSEVEQI